MRLMVQWLAHSFRLPFFCRGTKTALHRSFFRQMLQHKCHIRSIPSPPVAFHMSAAILSFPGDLASLSCFNASSTSDINVEGSTSQGSSTWKSLSLVTQTIWCCTGPIFSWCHRALSRCFHLHHLLHPSSGPTSLLVPLQYQKLFLSHLCLFLFHHISSRCNSAYHLSHYGKSFCSVSIICSCLVSFWISFYPLQDQGSFEWSMAVFAFSSEECIS